LGSLELLEEKLEHIKLGDAPKHLRFPHERGTWRRSVLLGRRTSPFIATETQGDIRVIKLSQDGTQGRSKSFLAANLPRTVLSTATATESPTALLARHEMQSWRLLQLEPASLREPDKFTTSPGLGADGSHLPATLYFLARSYQQANGTSTKNYVYDQVAARLSELINDVYAIDVDRDEKRELLTLEVTDREETVYPARSLSDGTLRFLALAVLELDPRASGLMCLEEPENGIHPERIPTILQLLQDIAVDVTQPVGEDNPLRQVIINTHSPSVVQQVPDDCLLVAELNEIIKNNQRFKSACFSWLPDTWREDANPEINPVARGKLLSYLNSPLIAERYEVHLPQKSKKRKHRRVIDRPDLQLGFLSLRSAFCPSRC
jgi:predicted ATPase